MRLWKLLVWFCSVGLIALGLYGGSVIWHGLSTADQPTYVETVVARTARNLAIPRKGCLETNPWKATPDVPQGAGASFLDRCAVCHGPDGAGQAPGGRNLYRAAPWLHGPQPQQRTEAATRYRQGRGVRRTG